MADSPTGDSFRYAGFWLRLVALMVDGAVILLVMWILGLLLGVNFATLEPTEAELSSIGLMELAALFIAWLYYAVMESTGAQATLGKLLMGIYVTDRNGNRVSFGRASLRYWAKFLSTVIFFVGYLMAAFTRHKQALHDIVAGCLVLKR